MNQQTSPVFTARDLEEARERGALGGEVRTLKWSAAIAIVAILGGLGMLYQNQTLLHERVARVEERVVGVEIRIDGIDKQLATITSQLATLISRESRSQ